MKKWYLVPALLALIVLIHACQKEKSFESGGIPAQGSLQSANTGDCLPKSVVGTYEVGTELTSANYLEVAVDVTLAGRYTVYTDTINGIYFSGAGIFTTLGLNTIRLTGHGTPFAAGTNNFIVTYGTSACTIQVVSLPEGGGGPAVFTFDGSPNACTNATAAGVYTVGAPLGAANTVALNVNVTTIGTYTITTTATNGMTFTATGTFGTLGAQTVTLSGSGTPVTSGPSQIPVPGTSQCTFTVNVVGQSDFTIDCASATVNGTYTVGVPLTSGNTVTILVDVTAAGGYSITGTTHGMTFTGTGTFTTTGPGQPVTLTGSGIPTDAGPVDLLLSHNSNTCAVVITVDPAAANDWSFVEGTNSYSGSLADATIDEQTVPPPVNITVTVLTYDGESIGNDQFFLSLADISGGINNGETYSSNSQGATNAAVFQFDGAHSYTADPSMTDVNMTFTVLNHDATNRTFNGTFSGTCKDENNAIKNITNGVFKGTYP